MKLLRTIKQKQQTAREEGFQEEAKRTITLDSFEDTLYIAYSGVPLIEIKENWTPKSIINKLSELRHHFVESRMRAYTKGMNLL